MTTDLVTSLKAQTFTHKGFTRHPLYETLMPERVGELSCSTQAYWNLVEL